MRARLSIILMLLLMPAMASAQFEPFPSRFQTRTIAANGTQIFVRVGGSGPAVILIHGFGDTGDMWVKLAEDLARDHTVVVPDLRGMGLSAKPADGYDKWNEAADMRAVLDALGIDKSAVVGHDIGTMVAYAYAARYRDKTEKLVVMTLPSPGCRRGMTSSAVRSSGILISVVPMSSGW